MMVWTAIGFWLHPLGVWRVISRTRTLKRPWPLMPAYRPVPLPILYVPRWWTTLGAEFVPSPPVTGRAAAIPAVVCDPVADGKHETASGPTLHRFVPTSTNCWTPRRLCGQ